jgi:two-component system response regulator (stage 0 sporulation protein F)
VSRILVVEDDGPIRRFVSELLADEGHDVTTAMHGADALEMFTAGADFDLIVLDARMPVMDGAEFLEQLARRALLPRALVMTAARELAELSPLVHVSAYVAKPFDLEVFLASVERVLAAPPGTRFDDSQPPAR